MKCQTHKLSEWRPTADLFVVGQHTYADSIAQLSRQIWPKPLAFATRHRDGAHHAGGARWRCRRAPANSIDRIDCAVAGHFVRGVTSTGPANLWSVISSMMDVTLMAALQRNIQRAASTDSSVLICGRDGHGQGTRRA